MTIYYQIISQGPKQARVFLVQDDILTIRTLDPITINVPPGEPIPPYTWATPEQIDYVFNQSAQPFTTKLYEPQYRTVLFPATYLTDFDGDPNVTAFLYNSELGWKMDANVLGVDALSERSTWLFSYEPLFGPTFLNRTNLTLQFKTPLQYLSMTERFRPMLTFYQPYGDTPLAECTFVMNFNQGAGHHHNFPNIVPLPIEEFPAFPAVQVSGPATISAGDIVTVNVSVLAPGTQNLDLNANVLLIVEEIAGYAPMKRVQINAGSGSFKIRAMDLDPGMEVKVKINWRNWTSAAVYTATVI